ncbi:MAG: Mur ligase family protein [Planctomycetota bacterium]
MRTQAAHTEPVEVLPGPVPMALKTKAPFLIGIGGSGMSALARLLAADRARVAGSDSTATDITADLQTTGIPVHTDADAAALPEQTDLVITSAAVRPDHPQLLEAAHRGVPHLTYAEALGTCMNGRTGVSIAGTHGKSTTTAMLGVALTDAGLDPSVIVGATCDQLAKGALPGTSPQRKQRTSPPSTSPSPSTHDRPVSSRLGAPTIPAGPLATRPGLLLAEACEYNRSFHHHRPTVASIANVEADHLDIYGSLDAVVEAFAGFAKLVPAEADGGRLLIGHDGAHRREITAGLTCRVETIGFSPSADWPITFDPSTREITVRSPEGHTCAFTMAMPGEHNATNAAVAAALAITLGADPETVGRSLSAFTGLDRRMHFRGEKAQRSGPPVRVYDDYGHHPTEIDATLRALRQHERPERHGGRLVVVFQPHQHSRTRFLLEEFATSFEQADVVIVPQIYFVRDSEAEKQRINATDLVDKLRDRGVRAMHLHPFGAIVEALDDVCRPGDTLVVMGAGPVWTVARDYLHAST